MNSCANRFTVNVTCCQKCPPCCVITGCLGSPATTNGAFSCGVASPIGSLCAATCNTGFAGNPSSACKLGPNGIGSWDAVTEPCVPGEPGAATCIVLRWPVCLQYVRQYQTLITCNRAVAGLP